MLAVRLLATAVLVAACGTTTTNTTSPAVTTTTTTATVPTTTTPPRSVWCLERDAGGWTEPAPPQPYDPAPLDAEKADIQRRLDRTLAQELQTTDIIFGNMAETWADDPAMVAEAEDARRRTRSTIRALHRDAVAQLEARYVRLHQDARRDHDARQDRAAELAALELRNEMQRYELECQ